MICKACGHQNGDDSQFCSQCGLPLSIEDSLEQEQGERPVLSKVVPYVIPGQVTGVIPVRSADGSARETEEDQLEDLPSDSDAAQAPASELLEEPVELDESNDEPAQDSDDREADEDQEPSDSEADGDSSKDPEEDEAGEACEGDSGEASQKKRLLGPSGMVSWDREFPTAQITAVMPSVDDEDAAEAESDSAPVTDDAPEKDAPSEPADSEDDPSASEEADASGACEDDERACDGDRPCRVGSHVRKAAHGEDSSDESDDASDDEDSSDDDEEDIVVVGRHGSSVDRSALTEKLERIPEPGPGSTAVIPSILKKAPARFSDMDREKADAQNKIPAKWLKAAAAAVAFVVLLVAIKLIVFNVEVPYVIDASSREARTRLESAGFEVQVESKVTDEAQDGTVLSCDPECGSKQRKGASITMTVAASQTIPDVVGLDLETAREMLAEQGATNIKEAVEKSNQPENTVVSVSPGIGEPFSLDDEITLTVATTAYLPDVMGMSQDEAKDTLEEAGYVVEVKWVESDKEPGELVSTSPKAKELANIGSTVALNIASPGPSAFLHIMEYFEIEPASLSEYLKWKGFSIGGSFAYIDEWSGNEYVSQKWKRADGATVSFTPAPYIEDDVLDAADYMSQGKGFEGVRIYIPAGGSASLGNDLTMAKVEEYMEACGLEGMSDSCTQSDLQFNGKSGRELGIGEFICAQGTQDGKVWTILLTSEGAYIGAGGYECYEDMEPICDYVAVNEIFQN